MSMLHYALHLLLAVVVVACFVSPTIAADGPVMVFILAGQSNMEGKAKVSLLEHQAAQPETKDLFKHLTDGDGWVVREDVWIKFLDRKGDLTVGFGSPGRVGPELEFGNTVGDRYDRQVLIIKTAWGGKSLYRDFRPPNSGKPDDKIVEKLLANARKKNPETTEAEILQAFGLYYRMMLDEVSETLGNLADHFPGYKGQGYKIAGFVWFQGWNDMVNEDYTAAYAENMANFIRDVRRDLDCPGLPVVIGQLGVGGVEEEPSPKKQAFKEAQAAPGKLPEFEGNVKVVKTDVFWDKTAEAVFKKGWKEHKDDWEKVGSDYPFHYLGSAKTFCRIGKAFGEAIIELADQ